MATSQIPRQTVSNRIHMPHKRKRRHRCKGRQSRERSRANLCIAAPLWWRWRRCRRGQRPSDRSHLPREGGRRSGKNRRRLSPKGTGPFRAASRSYCAKRKRGPDRFRPCCRRRNYPAEMCSGVGFHGEVAPGDAEVVAARRIHIEGSAPLPENEARCPRRIVEGNVVELQDRVFSEESHGAVLEFHFRAAFVCGKNITLADRQIQPSGFPRCGGVRERVAVRLPGEPDVALNETQADDAGMAEVRRGGVRAHEERTQQNDQDERNQFAGSHIHPLTGTRRKSLDG